MRTVKKEVDPEVLNKNIQDLGFTVIVKENCKVIGVSKFNELLGKLKSPETLAKFGKESRNNIKKVALELGVALNKNLQPVMHSVGKNL